MTSRRAVLLVAGLTPTVLAWIYFVELAPPSAAEKPGLVPLFAYFLSKLAQFSMPILWFRHAEKARLGMPTPTMRGVAQGVLFGLAASALIIGIYFGRLRAGSMMATAELLIRQKVASFHCETPGRYLLLCLFLAGIHSLLEEYYWRWFFFGTLRQELPGAFAMALSGIAFAAHHVVVLWVYFPADWISAVLPFSVGIAVGGAAWAWLYAKTGNIWATWISHGIVDLAIFAVGYDLLFSGR